MLMLTIMSDFYCTLGELLIPFKCLFNKQKNVNENMLHFQIATQKIGSNS